MIKRVRTQEDQVLRKKAKTVKQVDDSLCQLLDDMVETMYANSGVGLAAPQVGILKRAIVVDIGECLFKLVNPEIVKGEGQVLQEEGCLSVPGWWGEVERFAKIRLKAKNEEGKSLRLEAEGLLAQVFQHEIDHLDGVLFIDRAVKVWEKLPEEPLPPEAPFLLPPETKGEKQL